MPCNWREAAGELVMIGWPASDVNRLNGSELMWWFETMNLAAEQAAKRKKQAKQNGK